MGILSWLKPKPLYIYGRVEGRVARKNRKTGAVQFVLWKAGEQGHAEDYWHNMDPSRWSLFTPQQPDDGSAA